MSAQHPASLPAFCAPGHVQLPVTIFGIQHVVIYFRTSEQKLVTIKEFVLHHNKGWRRGSREAWHDGSVVPAPRGAIARWLSVPPGWSRGLCQIVGVLTRNCLSSCISNFSLPPLPHQAVQPQKLMGSWKVGPGTCTHSGV